MWSVEELATEDSWGYDHPDSATEAHGQTQCMQGPEEGFTELCLAIHSMTDPAFGENNFPRAGMKPGSTLET